MKVKQIYNNNVILSENEEGDEIILVGRGVAFGLSRGSNVVDERIEKMFAFQGEIKRKFQSLIKEVPYNYILLTERIVEFIKKQGDEEISDTIYVTLTDHISNIVERVHMGVVFDSALLMNVKRLYHPEYELAKQVVEMLNEGLDIEVDKSEANFIALHIINAKMNSNMPRMYAISEIMNEILRIVQSHFEIDESKNNAIDRFLTHCRFFAHRVVMKEQVFSDKPNNRKHYEYFKEVNAKQVQCIEDIVSYIETKYAYSVSVDEKLYLMIHLLKLTE